MFSQSNLTLFVKALFQGALTIVVLALAIWSQKLYKIVPESLETLPSASMVGFGAVFVAILFVLAGFAVATVYQPSLNTSKARLAIRAMIRIATLMLTFVIGVIGEITLKLAPNGEGVVFNTSMMLFASALFLIIFLLAVVAGLIAHGVPRVEHLTRMALSVVAGPLPISR